jgi:hypothetical protein
MSKQVKIEDLSSTKRILDFSQFLNSEMMERKKSGELEWTDLVDVFEGMYIPACEREGRKLLKGNYKSNSTDDRFKVLWEVDGKKIQGEYTFNGEWWTVLETLKS